VFWLLLLKVSGAAGYLAAAGAAAGAAAAGSVTSQHHQALFIALMYAGPIIMSFGCFALIFALVVFCEARDRAIEYYIRAKLYASSAHGPRHCRLPFRQDVVELMVTAAKRRADREARRRPPPSLAVVVPASSPEEAASVVERADTALEDDSFNVDHQPAPLLLSVSVDRTTGWLLSNGMQSESTSSFCLNRSHPAQLNQLDFEQDHIKRFSKGLLDNGMLRAESSHVLSSASQPDRAEVDDLHPKCPDLGQDQSFHLALSNGTTPETLPESFGGISAGMADSVCRDEMSVDQAGWMKDWKSAEVTPLMATECASDDDTLPETGEPETASMTRAERSQVASASRRSSISSSSSALYDVHLVFEVDAMTTTALELNEDGDHVVDETVQEQSSPIESTPAPAASPGSSPFESRDLNDRSSSLAGSNDERDGGRPPTKPCLLPSPTPLATERASSGWRRGSREPETVGRFHAGIYCPPPLPPPPTSTGAVTSPGRSPRRHT